MNKSTETEQTKPNELHCETCGRQFLNNANPTARYCNPYCDPKLYNPKMKAPKGTFTYTEVQRLIQMIYSEFVELDRSMMNGHSLRRIIEQEVEQHPLKPIQIFNK